MSLQIGDRTLSADGVFTSVPVIAGRAYQSARLRLQRALRALGLPEVSAALAVADFSRFYRVLPLETPIQISLASQGHRLHLCLEVDLPQRLVASLEADLIHLRLERRPCEPDRLLLSLTRAYPWPVGADLAAARTLLQQTTAEELERAANLTQQALSHTQGRLSSVQEDLRIAADIQQRMLASREKLQRIHPAIDCHAFMVPCHDIGGDFYDVIHLDSDHLAVVVGDVSGKGITAAMMMATCMTLLRAYCESFRSPGRIIRKINPRLIDGNEEDCLFTTLFLAVINVRLNSLTYCNAGHNPALLQRVDGSIVELDEIHGPAVGVMDELPYGETRLDFNPGDRLLLYTDGASEAFNPAGELYGVERLRGYLRQSEPLLGSCDLLAALLADLNQFSASELPHDDVTLLAVQRTPGDGQPVFSRRWREAATPAGMAAIMAVSDAFCAERGIGASISGRLQLVLDELLINVISHGARAGGSTPTIQLLLRHLPRLGRLVLELRDDGQPFNPLDLVEPDIEQSIEERELGGLGIFLIRGLARTFSYSFEPPWNCVLLEIDCLANEGS